MNYLSKVKYIIENFVVFLNANLFKTKNNHESSSSLCRISS